MTEILIIGGGIIGLTIARELHKIGLRKITIVEKGRIGKESSFAAAGMLAPNAETEKLDDFYHFCNESNKLYPKFSEELLMETGVDVELDQNGTIYAAFNQSDLEKIQKRFEWQKKAGLRVEQLSDYEVRKLEPFISPDVLGGLLFPLDWQVENRKLLKALEKYCRLNEIKIYEGFEVKKVITENGTTIGVETETEKVFGEVVILAAGAWCSAFELKNFTLPKIKPIRGQMISFRTAKRLFKKVIYSSRGYLVPRADGRVLIGATVEDAGFISEVTEAGIEYLRQTAFEIAPNLANLKIHEKWAGLRPFFHDGLPIIGEIRESKNLYIAAAHYRNGILLAPLTARILAEKIGKNRDSEYLKIFESNRFQQAKAL